MASSNVDTEIYENLETISENTKQEKEKLLERIAFYLEIDQPKKKRKKEHSESDEDELETKLDLNPGRVNWHQLETCNLVGTFLSFVLVTICDESTISKDKYGCDDVTVSKTNGDLVKSTPIENEGFSMLYCGTIFSHVVCHLRESGVDCKLRVSPVVMCHEDNRKNKKCYYRIYKILNSRTLVTIELKELVDMNLSSNRQSLAQLVLEILYCKRQDKITYTKTIGILANANIWHILLFDLSFSTPTIVKYYCFVERDLSSGSLHQNVCIVIKSLVDEINS